MKQHGFSLVELSIVLVILGLLTGGILGGQSLIRASELRAIPTEQGRYQAAAQTFRDKYFAIPGDFRDATRFWGRLNGNADCVSNSGAAAGGSPGVCDGNGDGTLTGGPTVGGSGEPLQFWRQLALAGLIEGTYTGLAGSDNFSPNCFGQGIASDHVLGTNAPRSKLGRAGWGVLVGGNGGGWFFNIDFSRSFVVGGQTPSCHPFGQTMKPEEAWNIDTKMDDGRPGTGSVSTMFWNNLTTPGCSSTVANANDYAAATYNLNVSIQACSLAFRNAF